jgi:hypothetical protein
MPDVMTAPRMLAILKEMVEPQSLARKTYRANKLAGGCPFCGTLEKSATYCNRCYRLVKEAKELATKEGLCRNCLSRPVAPPREGGKYKGMVTQCKECREAAEQRKLDAKLSRLGDES